MTAASRENFSGRSITYNTVQFGGADSNFPSLPPEYRFSYVPVRSDSGRVTKYHRVTAHVSCVFFAASTTAMEAMMISLKSKLLEQGKQLTIRGLGAGFGTIIDVDWGPKPGPVEATPIGDQTYMLTWSIEFATSPCINASGGSFKFLALEFSETWQHDLERVSTRTISGYAEIPQHRNPVAPKNPTGVTADKVKDYLRILCPSGYRRVVDVWNENAAKNRIGFVVVDEQLPGAAPPAGISVAEADFDWESQGPGFSQSTVNMSMTLKTAPGYPNSLAGVLFIKTVMAKQLQMQQDLNGSKGTVMPARIRIRNRKYDSERITECSMQWTLTRCLNAMLKAAKIWEPLTPNNYNVWRAEMDKLSGANRGADGARTLPAGDLIIDACDGSQSATIGFVSNKPVTTNKKDLEKLVCPDVPDGGGWAQYDLRVQVWRSDDQTWHKRAVPYLPKATPAIGSAAEAIMGGPSYTKGESESDVIEYNGLPEVYVLLRFKALRFKHTIQCPKVISVAGIPATQVKELTPAPYVAFDLFECPVWYFQGWRLYRVNGYVPSAKPTGRLDLCSQFDKTDKTGNVKL